MSELMQTIPFRLATGQKTYALFFDGEPLEAFNCYILDLAAKSASHNTVKCVASDLRVFFQYLFSFDDADALDKAGIRQLTGDFLTEAVHQFPLYLALGESAPEQSLAKYAAARTGRKPTSHTTNQRAISSLKGFLVASATKQVELQQVEGMGLIDVAVAPDILFGSVLQRSEIPENQRRKLLKKSMLAGVVRHGPLLANSSLLKARKYNAVDNQAEGSARDKALPHELVIPLLNAASTLRDRCLWALLLGTGLRPVEGLSLLLQDIDVERQQVFCVNPATRPLAYSSRHFERLEGELATDMAFKGRSTEKTLFIEPFKTYFFETLGRYLREERQPLGCDHSFLFVVLKAPFAGRPLVLSSQSTRAHPFKKALVAACKSLRMDVPKRMALHSCRHFYGVHCLNYLITGVDVYGRPIRGLDKYMVQQLMGHMDVKSTEVYAKPAIERIVEQTQNAIKMLDNFAQSPVDNKLLLALSDSPKENAK